MARGGSAHICDQEERGIGVCPLSGVFLIKEIKTLEEARRGEGAGFAGRMCLPNTTLLDERVCVCVWEVEGGAEGEQPSWNTPSGRLSKSHEMKIGSRTRGCVDGSSV